MKNSQEHVETLLWVDLGMLPDPHPAALSFPLLNKTGGENKMKKLIGQGKDQKIIYQLLSLAKHTQFRKD